MKRVLLPVLLLAGVLAGGRSTAAAGDHPSPIDPHLEKIRSAFQKGDARPLRDLCQARSRVHLVLIGTEVPAGYMSPDQMYFLLNRFFSDVKTVNFDFLPPQATGDQAVRMANWRFRKDEQEPLLLKLQFQFIKEGADWFLTEIRVLP